MNPHTPPTQAELRIYTRCPSCHNDTLTLNKGHLLCTWHECKDPTAIDTIWKYTPRDSVMDRTGSDLITYVERLRAELRDINDIALTRLQFPDGTVPYDIIQCAKGWHKWCKEMQDRNARLTKEVEELRKDKERLAFIVNYIWETRWVSEEADYQDMVGMVAAIRSGNFDAIDAAMQQKERDETDFNEDAGKV
jgi:hypothetical protein